MKQIKFFIGTDVSKEWLDMSIVSAGKVLHHARIANKPSAIKRWLRQTGKRVWLYHTGYSIQYGVYRALQPSPAGSIT